VSDDVEQPAEPEPKSRRGRKDNARDGYGNYAESEEAQTRDAQAFRLRSKGATLDEIAVALGYYDRSHVRRQIKKHLETIVPPAANEYRQIMDAQLDELYRRALAVMDTEHFTVSHGQIVYSPGTEFAGDPVPLTDDSPVLAAMDRILKIQQRRAALWGLDAPAQQRIQVQNVRVTVDGADDV
jgi:hypothetical protein